MHFTVPATTLLEFQPWLLPPNMVVASQQVIEEAPAPDISQEFRRSIGESAVAAARAGPAGACCCMTCCTVAGDWLLRLARLLAPSASLRWRRRAGVCVGSWLVGWLAGGLHSARPTSCPRPRSLPCLVPSPCQLHLPPSPSPSGLPLCRHSRVHCGRGHRGLLLHGAAGSLS